MSNPSNVLSDFQSYSYHHVLLATDGSSTSRAFRESVNLGDFRRAQGTPSAGDYAVRNIQTDDGQGRFVVLIDTMTDSKLSIESVKWETIVAPKREGDTDKGLRYGNTIEVDGEIIIQEPYGLDLYRILANASRDLGKSPASIVYVLKTIFVGNHSDGSSEMISTVRPFEFVLTDIVSTIDNKGTMYKLEIVGMQNGVSKLPQHALAAQGISIEIQPGEFISNAVKKFEQALNAVYNEHVDSIYGKLKAADNTQTPEILDKKFQRVKYTFSVDDVYTKAPYTAGTVENKSTQGENGVVTLTTGPSGTIESMLHKIMNSCAEVDRDGKATNTEEEYYIYKLVSTVLPSPDDSYNIHYEIRRYLMIQQDQDGELIDPSPGEFIEFDYMYTGQNVDVLEFDLKFDLGLSFFMTVATAPNLPRTPEEWKSGIEVGELTGTPNTSWANPVTNSTSQQLDIRAPLYLSTKVDDPLIKNKQDSLSGASYEQLFKRHAALEHVEASIKIAGNPNLLDEIVNTINTDEDPTAGNTGLKDVSRTPALIKVNVLFPTDNNLSDVKEFWYKGFYNIYSITQNFDGGLFTQDIQMFSVPRNTKNGIDKTTGAPGLSAIPRDLLEPLIAPTGAPCTVTPYNYDTIVGFTASEYTKEPGFVQRVEEIAFEMGTLPEWLMALISFESGGTFSPSIVNNTSGATGLIQFLPSTAMLFGTTTTALALMTATEQLTYVRAYFADQINRGLSLNTLEALYTAVLSGTARSDANYVLFSTPSGAYTGNAYLDIDNDGNVTTGEAASQVAGRLFFGVPTIRNLLKEQDISPAAIEALNQDGSGSRVTQAILNAVFEYQTLEGLSLTGYINDETVRSLAKIPQPEYDGCSPEFDHLLGPDYPINQRNHNPLNIRKTKAGSERWNGEVSSPNAFAKFTSPQLGLRAGMFLLRRVYFNTNKLTSVDAILNKWAPVADNSVDAVNNYVTFVSNALNVAPREPLNIDTSDSQLIAMAKAMASVEGGPTFEEYPDLVYTEALTLLKG